MHYNGYRHIHYNPRKGQLKLWTWDVNTGERICIDKPFNPFLYVETPNGEDGTSIYNTKLKKVIFDNSFERNKYVKQGGIKRLFFNLPVEQQALIEEFGFKNQDKAFSQFPLKIFTIDIETYSPDHFPEPDKAEDPITLITIHDSLTNEYHTWGLEKDFYPKQDNVHYYQCVTETDLLRSFLKYWRKDYPDMVVGWNMENFDIPYIINRIINKLGEDWANRLSPIDEIYKRENILQQFGKLSSRWYIRGISLIDYMDAYITFSRNKQESYSLNHIGTVELGIGKVKHSGNLSDLQNENWDKFVEYNIQDVKIIVELEKKLQFLMLTRMLAYLGMTNFESALGTVSIVTGAMALQALGKGMIIPTFPMDRNENYAGGFVKDPNRGLHECIVSFDANSLYPNTIITLNISPETKIGRIRNHKDGKIDIELINGKMHTFTFEQFSQFIKSQEVAITKAGVLYSQKHKGFCPELIERIYADRVKDKDQLKKIKNNIRKHDKDSNEAKALKKEIEFIDIQQYTKKILLNRIYGTFANKYSPFCDIDAARSITMTGQAVVKQAAEIGIQFAKKHGIDKDINIYSDTDSVYFTFKELFDKCNIKLIEDKKISDDAYKMLEKFDKELNSEITLWAQKTLYTKDSRFVFKRESICDAGIFLEKKRYILHILDEEGIPTDKIKYVGVEVATTSISNSIKPLIQNIVKSILKTKDFYETQKIYRESFEQFKKLGIEDIAWPRGIKDYDKYASKASGYSIGKGTPIHCKASIYHNKLIDDLGLESKYEKIKSGDKIKFLMVDKNKYNIEVIGFKNELPIEFDLKADYEIMFNKTVFSAVERLYNALNWKVVDLNEEQANDLFSLLS